MPHDDWARRIWDLLRAEIYAGPRGTADWSIVDPYLIRHAAHHAAAADRLGDLVADVDYLAYADAPRLQLELVAERTGALAASAHRVAYQASYPTHVAAAPRWRRDILALDAARLGAPGLSSELSRGTGWTVRWSTGSGRSAAIRQCLLGHEERVSAVVTLELGRRQHAVTGSLDGRLVVWDLRTGAAIQDLEWGEVGPAEVRCIARGTVGGAPVVVVGDADGHVTVWNAETGERVLRFHAAQRAVATVATADLAPGDPVIVTGDADGVLASWGLVDGKSRGTVAETRSAIGALAVVPADHRSAGTLVVTGSADGRIVTWNLQDGREVRAFGGEGRGAVTALAVTRMQGRLVCVSGDERGELSVWDMARGELLRTLPVHHFAVSAVVERDGKLQAITAGGDGRVTLWDLDTGTEMLSLPSPVEGWTCVAVCEIDGRAYAVSGGFDGIVRVWDLDVGSMPGTPTAGHRRPVRALGRSRVGPVDVVVSVGADGEAQARDLHSGVRTGLRGLTGPADITLTDLAQGDITLACVVPDPDGSPVAVTCTADGAVHFGAIGGQAETPRLPTPPSAVAAVVVDDGVRPLVAVDDAIWALTPGGWRTLAIESSRIVALGGGSGTAFAVAMEDGSVVVRDIVDAVVRMPLEHGDGEPVRLPDIHALCMSNEGDHPTVLIGIADGFLVWQLGENHLRLSVACPDPVAAIAAAGPGAVAIAQGPDVIVVDMIVADSRR